MHRMQRERILQMGLAPAALAALLAVPGAAHAATTPITAYYPETGVPVGAPAQAVMQIPVTASIGGVCGFVPGNAPNGTIDAGQIDVSGWSGQVPFTVRCTAPWRIAVSSLNGALATPGPDVTGYTRRAPYDVKLHVNADGGIVERACAVALIDQAAGVTACDFEGTASPANGLLLQRSYDLAGSYIQASAPAYAGSDILVAGTYGDTLTVSVSPAS
ncbi:MAG: hypothetical protein RLZZ427_156 [Pseudomonadota bacterium]|jgi:hypothetical protein